MALLSRTCVRALPAHRLATHAAARRLFTTVPEPPLPSPEDALLDRSGSVSSDKDPFMSRKLQGRGGAYRGRDVVPMWIADMDFRCAQPIVDAVVACAARGIYGYTNPPDELIEHSLRRLQTTYGAPAPEIEWVSWLPGLVPALNHAVRVCKRAEGAPPRPGVVVLTPAYPPFLHAPRNCGAELLEVPLLPTSAAAAAAAPGEEVRYEIDWPLLEQSLAAPDTRLMLLCNPHNPTGRCWPAAELERIGRLCVEHGVTLCSDEVWGEVPLDGAVAPFTSALALLEGGAAARAVPGLREQLVVLTSPSKCYNVATLNLAVSVVPHEPLRAAMRAAGADMAEVTPFGYFGAAAAYGDPESEAWRRRLIAYLRANREHAVATLQALPGVRVARPESSYLLWVDATHALPPGAASAAELLLSHGVGVNDGRDFGAGAGCFRVNFGCTRHTLSLGLDRIVQALGGAR